MDIKILKNDIKRNLIGNMALVLFMTFAALLFIISVIIVIQLGASMSAMYEAAKPPHFLQMHKGELVQEKIDDFNASFEGLTQGQTLAMINIYGDDITVYGEKTLSLSDSRLDISLVKQNKELDLLLDSNRNRIELHKGQIGIPVILLDSYDIKIGDRIEIQREGVKKSFTVASYVYDAQMNSTLVSSTRILLSDQDFEELFGKIGETEYIIEAYFTDKSLGTDYQTAYENAGLPNKGPAITYSQIVLISALGDIIMAIIIATVSILLILIALLSVKYTLMAGLEDEVGEIGSMKAIGLPYRDIRNIYYQKYRIIIMLGLALAYLIALGISGTFIGKINKNFANSGISPFTILLPLLICLLIYIAASAYCKRILKKIKELSVTEALVWESGLGKEKPIKDGLHRNKNIEINLLFSMREVFYGFKKFNIIFITMFLVSIIIMIPQNLVSSMKHKEFLSYMGTPVSDIMVEAESGRGLEMRYAEIQKLIQNDPDIFAVQETKEIRAETKNGDGEWMNLKIDSGLQSGSGLHYLQGKKPLKTDEIAVSKLNADKMEKNVGDQIVLRIGKKEERYFISGIYQDMTDGGMTAKSLHDFSQTEPSSYQFIIWLKEGKDPVLKAKNWEGKVGEGINIEPTQVFVEQTLGVLTAQIQRAVSAVSMLALLTMLFPVVLFMKLRLVKDRLSIALMKTIGFTDKDIRKQYIYKVGAVSLPGIFAGVVFSAILGEHLVSIVFSFMNLGVSRIVFLTNPWVSYLALPLIIWLLPCLIVWIISKEIEKYKIMLLINE